MKCNNSFNTFNIKISLLLLITGVFFRNKNWKFDTNKSTSILVWTRVSVYQCAEHHGWKIIYELSIFKLINNAQSTDAFFHFSMLYYMKGLLYGGGGEHREEIHFSLNENIPFFLSYSHNHASIPLFYAE